MNASEPSPQIKAAITALQLRAWSCAVTVRIARIVDDRESSWKTASGILIEFPTRAVIATAWHVLEEYRKLRAHGETVVLVCDNMPIPSPCTTFRDEAADIAFVDVPRTGRAGLRAVPYRPGLMWPPPSVLVDDSVLVCGFPKIFRHDGDEIVHGDLNLLLNVASSADDYFMLQVDWERLVQAGRVVLPPDQTDFGGASGGPAFLYDGGCNPLVGLVSQAGDTLPLWRIASLSRSSAAVETGPAEPV